MINDHHSEDNDDDPGVVVWRETRAADIGLVTYTPHDHNHCRQIIRTMIMNYKELAYKCTYAHSVENFVEDTIIAENCKRI